MEWNKLTQTGDYEEVVEVLAEVVKSWEFDGDPSVVESYRKLPPECFPLVLRQMGTAISKLFREEAG